MRKLFIIVTIISSFSIFASNSPLEVDCDGQCSSQERTDLNSDFLQNFSKIINYSTPKKYPETMEDDTRKVRSDSSPKWLAAVGRMITDAGTKDAQQCSISIVSDSPEKDGIIAITAAHCVDHWRNSDGSFSVDQNSITFRTNSNKVVKREIAEVLKMSKVPADYAIVKLNKSISKNTIAPLLNSPYDYADLQNDEDFHEQFKSFATMAGYSADKEIGSKGKVLTYDEGCHLNGGLSGQKKGYCYAYPGASGGPVVVTVALGEYADEEWQEGKRTYFVGSISGKNALDDHSKTLFTDTSHYTSILDPILAAH